MTEIDQHLKRLRDLLENYKTEGGDIVLGRINVQLGTLAVSLAKVLDKTQRRVLAVTWMLLVLTATLLFLTLLQTFFPPVLQQNPAADKEINAAKDHDGAKKQPAGK